MAYDHTLPLKYGEKTVLRLRTDKDLIIAASRNSYKH